MMIYKPRNQEDFICVDSETSKILHAEGFQPYCRELGRDRIYYIKNFKLVFFMEERGLSSV